MSTHEHTQAAFLITVAQPDPAEQAAMGDYAAGSFAVAGDYGAELITRLQVREQINGDTPAAIIGIARFPSAAAIRAMFDSAAYRALIPLRERAMRSLNVYISLPDQTFEMAADGDMSYLVTLAQRNPAGKQAFAQFQQGAAPIALKRQISPVGRIRIGESLIGDAPASFLIVAAFPDDDAIHGFVEDPVYRGLIPLRDQALDSLNLYIA